MIQHVVLITFVPEATDEQRQAVADALRVLPSTISEIVSYHVGLDLGLAEGNASIGVVAQFVQQDVHEEKATGGLLGELAQDVGLPVLDRHAFYPQPVEDGKVIDKEVHAPPLHQLALPGANRDDTWVVPAHAVRVARREDDGVQAAR